MIRSVIIFILLNLSIVFPLSAQDVTFKVPVLLDSVEFLSESIINQNLRNSYNLLKDKRESASYQYAFKISKSGKVIAQMYEDNRSYYAPITKFLKQKFNRYRWIPSSKSHCRECKIVSYCIMSITILPPSKRINILITAGDGSLNNYDIYEKDIKFE